MVWCTLSFNGLSCGFFAINKWHSNLLNESNLFSEHDISVKGYLSYL